MSDSQPCSSPQTAPVTSPGKRSRSRVASVSDFPCGGGTIYPHDFSDDEVRDRMALQHLAAAYGHAVDRRDYVLLRSLYHEDAIDDHSPYFCGAASAYVDWLPSMLSNW